jgi:UDP-galactopyranose mutase
MPFAINRATRFISPTKTPEYLAAGRPVVSTPIADVVHDYGNKGLVAIAEDAAGFAAKNRPDPCRPGKALKRVAGSPR